MNQSKSIAHMGVLALALLLVGCGKGNLSDPKSAIKTVSEAMRRGDAAAVKAGVVNADPKFIEVMTAVMSSSVKLHDAAVAKFGNDGETIAENKVPDYSKELDDADVKIDGDNATVTPKSGRAIKLKRDGGDWKLDFSQMPGMSMASAMAPMMQSIADANNATAGEIASGKYATAADAKKAIQEKMIASVMGGAKMPDGGMPGK